MPEKETTPSATRRYGTYMLPEHTSRIYEQIETDIKRYNGDRLDERKTKNSTHTQTQKRHSLAPGRGIAPGASYQLWPARTRHSDPESAAHTECTHIIIRINIHTVWKHCTHTHTQYILCHSYTHSHNTHVHICNIYVAI